MRLFDQHLHTRYSMDSQADPEANVLRAIELGLAGLTFTDHFDTHPTEWGGCEYDYDRLAGAVASLREKYGSQVFVGHGIEICHQPEQAGRILPYLEEHDFDLVILSVHWFEGRALHVKEHWDGLDASTATRAYLGAVRDAVRFVGELQKQGRRPFDVLGHLDLVKRYTQRYYGSFDVRMHADRVDEILMACLEAGLVPEINLSSLRQGLPEPMPPEWVARRFAELGGEAMCLGSDAHRPEDVGSGLADGAAMLKRAGIARLAVFRGRQRYDETL